MINSHGFFNSDNTGTVTSVKLSFKTLNEIKDDGETHQTELSLQTRAVTEKWKNLVLSELLGSTIGYGSKLNALRSD